MNSSRPSAFRKYCAAVAAATLLLQPLGAYAAPITTSVLSEIPLQGLNPVKPNIMFTVDDSGSMTWDYLPDWAVWNQASPHPNYCRDGRQCGGNSGINVGSSPLPGPYTPYQQVDPPLRSSDFNKIYYNPTATYDVGRRDDGTGLPCEGIATGCAGPWSRVYMNGFAGYPGANASTTVNLAPTAADIAGAGCVVGAATQGLCVLSSSVTAPTNNASWAAGVPDTLWCLNFGGSHALTGADYRTADVDGSICRRNGRAYSQATVSVSGVGNITTPTTSAGYNYPNATNPTNGAATTCAAPATQCKYVTPITAYGYPFYYTISSVQFCSTASNGWGTGTCGTRQDFASTKYVRFAAGTLAPGFNAAVFTRVDITSTGCRVTPGGASANGVLSATCPSGRPFAQEQANFAKFFAFNRTRILAMKTAAGIAFSALSDENARVGLHTLWENSSATAGFLNVTPFDTANKNKWFSHLYAVAPNNGTPLPDAAWRIGEYFSNSGASGLPGAIDPLDATTGQCQPNYHLLSTDGYWNAALSYASRGNNDKTVPALANLPGATGFTVGANFPRPYSEGPIASSNNLADLAMYYWIRDIRPALPNNVKDTIAPWQHVTLYGLSIGAQGNVVYPTGIDAIAAGANTVTAPAPQPINWPVATGAGGPESIDDLWHAALNTRGKFFNADNPKQLAESIVSALADFTDQSGTGTSVGIAGAQFTASKSYGYRASYEAGWWGDVKKYALDPNTGALPVDGAGNPINPPLWSAATQLDAQASGTGWDTNRRILTINDSNAVVPFRELAISPAQLASLNAGWSVVTPTPTPQDVLKYLRGDQSNEGIGSTNFRVRTHILGDIGYSGAVAVGAPSQPYLDAGNPGYEQFVKDQAGRTPMVYVGGNDGMVHALNDSPCLLPVCSTAEDAGKETWAFIPKALFSSGDPNDTTHTPDPDFQLGALSYRRGGLLPVFSHKFRVNATPRAWDYDFLNTNTNKPPPSGNDWRTILVGGLGAGGRSIYALDITIPVTPIEKESDGSLSKRVMWEFTDANLGYVFDAPTVVKTYRYGWVVLVASGYNNPGGKGILYVLNPTDGKILKQLSPDVAADRDPKSAKPSEVPTDADPRGLSTIRAYTASRKDPYVLQAYGGDLKGNVWRFDLSDPDESKWNVALIAKLTDKSGNAQPITTGVRIEIDQNNNVDRYLFVGTGKLLGPLDIKDTSVTNTLYVIRDGTRTAAELAPATPYSRKDLNAVTGSGVAGFAGPPTGRGWYQDAADSTEKIGTDVYADVQTVVYAFSKPTTDPCGSPLSSRLYARDLNSGNSVLVSAGGAVVPGIDIGGGIAGVALIQGQPGSGGTSSGDVRALVTTMKGEVFSFGIRLTGASSPKHRVSWRLLNRD